ncbi:MAG: transcription repressor NadR [Anaerovoracaceae bacterium]|jgi:transcriptional regulator of NAD metabolism
MKAQVRRTKILSKLAGAISPVSATALANELNVSRQVIVNDVAILRAAGSNLIATPRGYILQENEQEPELGIRHQIACVHGEEGMEDELNVIVDHGCKIVDVIIDHPVYGQLVGALQLSNRNDVKEFVERSEEAQPLSHLTNGLHLHTILCPTEEAFQQVKEKLKGMGILL